MRFNVLLLAALLSLFAVMQAKANLQQAVAETEVSEKAEIGANVEVESSEEVDNEASNSENALVSIRSMISDKLSNTVQWLLDEKEKEECCIAAFNLCERPPNVTQPAFNKQAKKVYLPKAKKECAIIKTQKMKTINQICNYYASHVVNCAYTPNTEEDFQRYLDNMPNCCEKANAFCKTKGANELFAAKKACMGYAMREPEDLCDMASSKECQID